MLQQSNYNIAQLSSDLYEIKGKRCCFAVFKTHTQKKKKKEKKKKKKKGKKPFTFYGTVYGHVLTSLMAGTSELDVFILV